MLKVQLRFLNNKIVVDFIPAFIIFFSLLTLCSNFESLYLSIEPVGFVVFALEFFSLWGLVCLYVVFCGDGFEIFLNKIFFLTFFNRSKKHRRQK